MVGKNAPRRCRFLITLACLLLTNHTAAKTPIQQLSHPLATRQAHGTFVERRSTPGAPPRRRAKDRIQINQALARENKTLHNAGTAIRRAVYFWTKAGPIVAHYRFTQWWLTARQYPRKRRDQIYEGLHDRYCQPSLDIVLHLQGLFTKIGQVLSARPDFVPHQYCELFATVQDAIPQWPYDRVEKLVRESLKRNQGLEWDEVFETMDHKALGSAAIGQCHRAILKSPWDSTDGYEGGKIVAVKVMHPGAEQRFAHDFQIFRWLCRIALPGWKPILNEIQRQMKTEFDYRNEAKNLDEVRINMLASPYSDKVTVPQPIHSLCSKNLLVMEMLEGKKFSDAIEQRLSKAIGSADAAKEFIRRRRETLVMGVSAHADATKHETNANEFVEVGKDLLEHCGVTSWIGRLSVTYRLLQLHRYVHRCIELMLDVHGHQIFLNGVFNGDCHPGNLMELSNGKIGLIDYGQTKRLTKEECVGIARVVSALGQNVIDEKKVGEAMRQFGFRTKNNSDKVLTMYAKLFFDSDDEAKAEGCVTPQLYLMKLSALDPLVQVPDAAIMTARTSYMFRGIGAISGDRIRTSKYWRKNADKALESS